jgi:hypothetical protein
VYLGISETASLALTSPQLYFSWATSAPFWLVVNLPELVASGTLSMSRHQLAPPQGNFSKQSFPYQLFIIETSTQCRCILADFWTLPLTSTITVYNSLPPQSVCLSKT